MKEEEEWVVSTCYGREHRLKHVAIDNKHAGVQGMPRLTTCDAESIMKTILAMKGATTKNMKTPTPKEYLDFNLDR